MGQPGGKNGLSLDLSDTLGNKYKLFSPYLGSMFFLHGEWCLINTYIQGVSHKWIAVLFVTGCCKWWKNVAKRIAAPESDHTRKSIGAIAKATVPGFQVWDCAQSGQLGEQLTAVPVVAQPAGHGSGPAGGWLAAICIEAK